MPRGNDKTTINSSLTKPADRGLLGKDVTSQEDLFTKKSERERSRLEEEINKRSATLREQVGDSVTKKD